MFLFILGTIKFKWKIAYFVLAIIGLIFLSDKISVYLFKDIFTRLRPCHNNSLVDLIHLVGSCGGKYGFVSSHAANTFALAVFSGLMLKKHYPRLILWAIIWASVVSYSRIYLGVHYPGDILVGAILGISLGVIVYLIVKQFNQKKNLLINM